MNPLESFRACSIYDRLGDKIRPGRLNRINAVPHLLIFFKPMFSSTFVLKIGHSQHQVAMLANNKGSSCDLSSNFEHKSPHLWNNPARPSVDPVCLITPCVLDQILQNYV